VTVVGRPHDRPRHAGIRSDQINQATKGRTHLLRYLCANAAICGFGCRHCGLDAPGYPVLIEPLYYDNNQHGVTDDAGDVGYSDRALAQR
jgi:hypothetical protein